MWLYWLCTNDEDSHNKCPFGLLVIGTVPITRPELVKSKTSFSIDFASQQKLEDLQWFLCQSSCIPLQRQTPKDIPPTFKKCRKIPPITKLRIQMAPKTQSKLTSQTVPKIQSKLRTHLSSNLRQQILDQVKAVEHLFLLRRRRSERQVSISSTFYFQIFLYKSDLHNFSIFTVWRYSLLVKEYRPKKLLVKSWWHWLQVSISSTFYTSLFCTKVLQLFSNYSLALKRISAQKLLVKCLWN